MKNLLMLVCVSLLLIPMLGAATCPCGNGSCCAISSAPLAGSYDLAAGKRGFAWPWSKPPVPTPPPVPTLAPPAACVPAAPQTCECTVEVSADVQRPLTRVATVPVRAAARVGKAAVRVAAAPVRLLAKAKPVRRIIGRLLRGRQG